MRIYLIETESYGNRRIEKFESRGEWMDAIISKGIQYRNMGPARMRIAEVLRNVAVATSTSYDRTQDHSRTFRHDIDYVQDDINVAWQDCDIQRWTEAQDAGQEIEGMVCDYGDGGDYTPQAYDEWRDTAIDYIFPS